MLGVFCAKRKKVKEVQLVVVDFLEVKSEPFFGGSFFGRSFLAVCMNTR